MYVQLNRLSRLQGSLRDHGPYCYLWSNKAKTWDDAGQTCRREGGYLASVTSNAINDYILKEGAIKRISDSIWIGDLFR